MHFISVDILTIISYFYYSIIFINLLVLIAKLRLLKSHAIFLAIIGFSLSTELFKFLMPEGYNIQPLHHTYIPIELWLMLFYYLQILYYPIHRRIVIGVTVIATLIMLYLYLGPNSIWKQEDFPDFVLSAICICIFVAFFFRELINQKEFLRLTAYPDFWINTANLLFYGGCLFVMGLNSYVRSINPQLAMQLYHINHTLNILLYLMYLTAFLWIRKTK